MKRDHVPTTMIAVLAVMAVFMSDSNAQRECRNAALRMMIAGRFDVQDDYFESLAKAQNAASAEERAEAEVAAREERGEASSENQAIYQERLRLCRDLGGGAYLPEIEPEEFLAADEMAATPNPYWPLIPGHTWTYRGETEEGTETIVVIVTDEVREIEDVECRVVYDVAMLDGEMIEETYDWYAQDLDGNVWYFGEETFEYEDGRVVSIDGSFQAGEDGAQPGILIKAAPEVGDMYRQEYLLGEAEDVALVWGHGATRTVPYGTFGNLVKTAEWTPLEPGGLEFKYYAPGLGLVLEENPDSGERVELISFEQN